MLIASCGTAKGDARHNRELTRMISEKTAAVFEGALASQVETMRLAGKAATGRLDPADFAGAPASIAAAGLAPAFRRVRANSKRLSRPSR